MSAPEFAVRFTRRARSDLRAILLYSFEQWGEEQQTTYARALDRAFLLLAENPRIGRPRDELHPGCRSYPVEQHIIYYEVSRRTIRVLRVLHARSDPRRAFAKP